VDRLVQELRAQRGGLTGCSLDWIEEEVARLAMEEECPVCLDSMAAGGLRWCGHCGHRFHSRYEGCTV
jgi:hypothetical protein